VLASGRTFLLNDLIGMKFDLTNHTLAHTASVPRGTMPSPSMNITAQSRGNMIAIYTALIGFNIAVWTWAFLAFGDNPILLGTAFLAYSFGLRHAVDADHIAAIDNVTRKLMQAGKQPLGVGLFFSLGHSTVVVLASIGIAVTAMAFKDQMDEFHPIGEVIGTSVSAIFLLLIGAINFVILLNVYKAFRRVKNGGTYSETDLDILLANGGGILTRIFRRLFRLITRSWHMYPLGFLFGLGFDTATEVALLGITAAQASSGLSMWSILIFPALFTAGMTLLDTTDSILMVRAYGWAFAKPVRKLYYNMTITLASVLVAVIVGGIGALGLIGEKFSLSGGVWDVVGTLNEELEMLGYLIIGVFVGSWLLSMLVYRLKGYDRIEARLAS
jgi:nickel/cobalt transporter (NiCoT) family protein